MWSKRPRAIILDNMSENMPQGESHLPPRATHYLQSKLLTAEGYLEDALLYEKLADRRHSRSYPESITF